MKHIILVAETGADIPPEAARRYGVYIVPMHVAFGDATRDDGDFPSEEICAYYERTHELPKTSGSTPEDFIQVFDQIHAEHPEAHILHLAYSSATTCSYQSARIAAEGRDYVTSLDTKTVTVGQYSIVVRMARLLEEHPEWEIGQAVSAAEELIRRSRMCFLPDELEYLRAGGRVSNAVALCGKLLGIHPRIELLDGRLVATKKPRGKMAKLAPRLVEEFAAQERLDRDELWLVWTPGFPDELRAPVEESAKRCGFRRVTWVKAGGVITTHGAPPPSAWRALRKTEKDVPRLSLYLPCAVSLVRAPISDGIKALRPAGRAEPLKTTILLYQANCDLPIASYNQSHQ